MKQSKVLIVDDCQTNIALLKGNLKRMGLKSIPATNGEDAIALARTEKPDLILLDVMMPDMNGFEVCKALKSDHHTDSIPVIFISAKDQPVDKIKGLKYGAIDYVSKPFDSGELRARIGVVLRIIELQKKILSLANTDELTGLINRRHFFEIFERELLQAKMKGQSLTIVMVDIDHFKYTNDTYGHLAGDEILKQMGKILLENTYPLDITARYGGEEFIILMPDTSPEQAAKAAEKLRQVIDDYQWNIQGNEITVTISAGLFAANSKDIRSLEDVIKKADKAMYAAKQRGRNRLIKWSDIETNTEEKQQTCEKNVTKDFKELQNKISNLTNRLRSQTMSTISAFAKAMSLAINDPYMEYHAQNVKAYSTAISEQLDLSEQIQENIANAALLHDLGKIGIPNEILKKTGPLTREEKRIIRQHPVATTQILIPTGFFKNEMSMIRHHHERFDGTGYPDGLKGKEIEIGARIIAVADSFDSMTSSHIYCEPKTAEHALAEIKACTGTQFDPEVVEAFEQAFSKHKDRWPLACPEQLESAMDTISSGV
jgi:diguanylate cyclase (GGDEF)-like protein